MLEPASNPLSQRKQDHIQIALGTNSQFGQSAGFENYWFMHQALPELDLAAIDTQITVLGKILAAPLLISSMTGGPLQGQQINQNLALAAQTQQIGMGLGSLRVIFEYPETLASFLVRDQAPDILLLANLGAVQLNYGFGETHCAQAVDKTGADGLYLHLNPLQEAIQPEGDTNFSALWPKIAALCQTLDFPILLKECGSGLSENLAEKAAEIGIAGLEVSGAGGTSWSLIESQRSSDPLKQQVGRTFANWGIPTPLSIQLCRRGAPELLLIGSGGIRSGLDAAKAIALGADLVSIAQPFLKGATESPQAVAFEIQRIIQELKLAMFCVGAKNLAELRQTPIYFGTSGFLPGQ